MGRFFDGQVTGMRRFFVQPEDIDGPTGVLRGREARHLSRVLRLRAGDSITLFDGSGKLYEAVIDGISRQEVTARILSECAGDNGAHYFLHVGMPFLKGAKMDFVVQKATELGVSTISPFLSTFCVAGSEDVFRQQRRLQRWQRISLEACKQCGRSEPLRFTAAQNFSSLVMEMSAVHEAALKLILWEKEETRGLGVVENWRAAEKTGPVYLLIGPEGGFADAEVKAAVDAGFVAVSVGSRVLRAETALLTAMAVVQYLLGNLDR